MMSSSNENISLCQNLNEKKYFFAQGDDADVQFVLAIVSMHVSIPTTHTLFTL